MRWFENITESKTRLILLSFVVVVTKVTRLEETVSPYHACLWCNVISEVAWLSIGPLDLAD